MTTIDDIASECRVSRTAVSQVLNGKDRKLSAATRERIRDTMRRLNYRPSAKGRALSTGRSNTIGVVTKMQSHLLAMPYFADIVSAVLDGATEAEMTMALFNGSVWSKSDPQRLLFADGRCDGLIVIGAWQLEGLVDGLIRAGIPFVAVNSGELPDGCASIDIDNVEAGRAATRHLVSLGRKRIAYCHDEEDSAFSRQRCDGYAQALHEAHIPVEDNLIIGCLPGVNSYGKGLLAASINPPIDAVFCAGDQVALSVMQAIRDSGMLVPDDVAVVGVNGESCGAVSVPSLTTVSQRLFDLGTEAVRMLLAMIENPSAGKQLVWPTELIIRSSTTKEGS
ncbi:MAG: LacI family DNA-binding transcriptional regulator [Capsulimonadaceae bacterium]|nr:LacI family DNA-binding transcriptional regulator [Capsulimonadaceae bacterium]